MMISLKLAVSVEAVSDSRAARLNGLGNKSAGRVARSVPGYDPGGYADLSAIALGGHCDKAFARVIRPTAAPLSAAPQ